MGKGHNWVFRSVIAVVSCSLLVSSSYGLIRLFIDVELEVTLRTIIGLLVAVVSFYTSRLVLRFYLTRIFTT